MCTHQYAIWIGIVIRDLQGIAGTASFVVLWNRILFQMHCIIQAGMNNANLRSYQSLHYSSFNLQGIHLLVMESVKLESVVNLELPASLSDVVKGLAPEKLIPFLQLYQIEEVLSCFPYRRKDTIGDNHYIVNNSNCSLSSSELSMLCNVWSILCNV